MLEIPPEAVGTTAQSSGYGAHRATYLPESKRDRRRLYLFERGVVAQPHEEPLFASHWQELSVYEQHLRESPFVTHNYTLVDGRGRNILFKDWPKATEFGGRIQQAVTSVWLPLLYDALAQGKTWDFIGAAYRPKDKLAISLEGLTLRGRFWPWSQIRSIEIKGGYFSVKVSGKMRALAYHSSQIPNVHVLFQSATRLHAQSPFLNS
jgi:hypothetical protein